jgi:hypothetical protein
MKLITFPSKSLSTHMIFPSLDNGPTIDLFAVATLIPSRSAANDATTICQGGLQTKQFNLACKPSDEHLYCNRNWYLELLSQYHPCSMFMFSSPPKGCSARAFYSDMPDGFMVRWKKKLNLFWLPLVYSNWDEKSSQTNLLLRLRAVAKSKVLIGALNFVLYAFHFRILSNSWYFCKCIFCLKGKISH